MKDNEKETSRPESGGARYPELLTVTPSPHMRHYDSTRSIMLDVLIALLPALLWGIYRFGVRAFVLTLISVISCVIFEFIFCRIMKKPDTVGDLSACVTGVILAMNLPSTVPLWLPVVGSAFAILIVKELFGGLGKNIVNPALAARVFLFLSFSALMSEYPALDGVASATPLKALKSGSLPENELIDLFIGNKSGCIGEVSAVLLLAGGLYLIFRRVITWHIPVCYIATVAALTFAFPRAQDNLSFMLYELVSGGLILGAVFMATDYATSPVTPRGRMIYGVGCGLITVFIRYFGGYQEGVSFAVLIMNLLVWHIDKIGRPKVFGGGKRLEKKK